MPVSRSLFKWCFCEECIETSDRAEDGTPKGVLIAERLMAAHLQHTKCTQAERAATGSPCTNTITDLLVSQLDALALIDNKPPVSHPNPTPPLSIMALTDDLEQLTLLDHFVAHEPRVAIPGDVSQKNIHRPTVKALMVLDNIEFCIQQCFRLLPADLVVTQKRAIMLEIDGLEAQFNSQKPPEMDLHAAVEFDTSKS
ncbi:uncharacterized protein BJ212DRAFT_1298616 [Suillus subaureus]|uniref:Uncharacterized protein n=1 Tax=Suillus subaureus TaxID=48587 RepID=A0A9P7EE68_9AGAM|nr:uncharacterized protein BJ212DRAFT_1298616 [Suillus subaureus]KAG1818530.1 hypothetical protein BJ212DRAFT_1298616 [Suillus subaureus]